jgi:hypothetical protein
MRLFPLKRRILTGIALSGFFIPVVWSHTRVVASEPSLTPYQLLTHSFVRSVALDALALVASVFLLVRLAGAVVVRLRSGWGTGQSGFTEVTEFVLLLPLLLCFLLLTLQLALIVHAKFVVNYAAFCAVRSAIVVYPDAIHSQITGKTEEANQIDVTDPESPKVRVIRRACALACIGISPPWTVKLAIATGSSPSATASAELAKVAYILFPPMPNIPSFDISKQFLERAPYALNDRNTKVEIAIDRQSATGTASASYSLVTAKVTYRYLLAVPFADRLFGKPFLGGGLFGRGAYYIPITEQYTLPSEDDPTFPDAQRPADLYSIERFE